MEQAPVASGVALTAVGAIAFGMLPLVLGALYDDGVSPESALLYRYLGSLPPLLLWLLWRRAPRDGLLLSLAAGVAIGTGTINGLILVYLGGAMGVNTWLIKGFFDTIPHDLVESARVDGATHWQIYSRIIMPLAAPILAVVGLLAFVTILNDFVIANAVLSNNEDSWTLSIGLFRFVADRYGARWGPFAAGAVIGSVPTVLLFLYLQKYIVSGLTQGSVKG